MINAVFHYFPTFLSNKGKEYGRETYKKILELMKARGVNTKLVLGWGHTYFSDLKFLDSIVLEINGIDCRSFPSDSAKMKFILENYLKSNIRIPDDLYNKLLTKLGCYIEQLSKYEIWGLRYGDFLNTFNIFIRFFYQYLSTEKIDIVYFSHVVHLANDLILYEIAKYLNIKTFFLNPFVEAETKKPLLIYTDTMDYDNFYHLMTKKLWNCECTIPKTYKKDLPYMKNIHIPQVDDRHFGIGRKEALGSLIPFFRKKYTDSDYFITKIARRVMKVKVYKDSLKARDNYIQPVDFSQKYVYFGLHLQPEATTTFYGGKYSDQLLAIENLASILPDDWKIYVKENPKQDDMFRGKSFYERLHLIDKAVLVPMETNTYDLIEHSQFVASITGTMIYEAVCGGKPALMFGHIWYDRLPGVFKYTPDLKVDDIINYQIDHDELQQKVRNFYSTCLEGSLWEHYSFDDENERRIVEFMLSAIPIEKQKEIKSN